MDSVGTQYYMFCFDNLKKGGKKTKKASHCFITKNNQIGIEALGLINKVRSAHPLKLGQNIFVATTT